LVAYTFTREFIEPIRAGAKGGTIRLARKGSVSRTRPETGGHARPGDELSLYYGLRRPGCFLIKAERCFATVAVRIDTGRREVRLGDGGALRLTGAALEAFARFDGFDDFNAMAAFFQRAHKAVVFDGWNIQWGNIMRWLDP
jgi:hypothetical protein